MRRRVSAMGRGWDKRWDGEIMLNVWVRMCMFEKTWDGGHED